MKKNFIGLLLFSFLSIFLFYNCQKENKAEPTHEESLNSLAVKMSQNKDFQKMVASLPAVRKEYAKILQPLLESKKNINEMSVEERKFLLAKFVAGEMHQAFRTDRKNIRTAFPALKGLSRTDHKIVYQKAFAGARELLKIKRNLEPAFRTSEDCLDSCYWAYADGYDGCDESAAEDLDICDETHADCVDMCQSVIPTKKQECLDECDNLTGLCYAIAAIDWLNCFDNIDSFIESCQQGCPQE